MIAALTALSRSTLTLRTAVTAVARVGSRTALGAALFVPALPWLALRRAVTPASAATSASTATPTARPALVARRVGARCVGSGRWRFRTRRCVRARRVVGRRVREVGIRVVVGAARLRARRMAATSAATAAPVTAATTTVRAAMLGPAARILVRGVLARLAAFRARRVRPFLDLELRRRREFDRALQQLLDVPQQRDFIGRDE